MGVGAGAGGGGGDAAKMNLDVKTNVNLLASRSLQTLVEDEEDVSFLDLT